MLKVKKVLFSILGILIIFLILFSVSTNVILGYVGLNVSRSKYSSDDEVFQIKSDINFWIDYINVSGDILGEVSILGWAYIPNAGNVDNKYIDILWVSDKDVYVVDTQLSERVTLADNGPHQFEARFSMLRMADGVYQMYINSHENDDVNGFIPCDRYYQKQGRNFTCVYPEIRPASRKEINLDNVTTDSMFYHSIDTCSIVDNYINFNGWGLIKGEGSEQTNIYVVLYNDFDVLIYETTKYSKEYLRQIFQTDIYDDAFFYSNININLLKPNKYFITLLLEDKNGNYTLCPWSRSLNIGSDGSFSYDADLQETQLNREAPVQENVTFDDFVEIEHLYHSIDICHINNGYIQIKGWAVEVGTPSDKTNIYIVLTNSIGKSVMYNTKPYTNTYLRDVLENGEIYDTAFFECNIPLNLLNSDNYTLDVLVQGAELGKSFVSHSLNINEDGTIEYIP